MHQHVQATADRGSSDANDLLLKQISQCGSFQKTFRLNHSTISICSDLLHRSSLSRKIDRLTAELPPDDLDAEFLLTGIAQGFRLIDDINNASRAYCANYKSALDPAVKLLLDALFLEELSLKPKLCFATNKFIWLYRKRKVKLPNL